MPAPDLIISAFTRVFNALWVATGFPQENATKKEIFRSVSRADPLIEFVVDSEPHDVVGHTRADVRGQETATRCDDRRGELAGRHGPEIHVEIFELGGPVAHDL